MCERFFLYYCWSLLIRYSCYLNTLSLFFFFFKQTHSNTNLLLDKAAQQLLIGRAAGGHNKKSFECHELNILRQTMALYSFSHWSHAAAAFHILPLTSTSALITWSPAPERVGRGGRAVSWPEVFLVAHLHPGLTQHGHALGVLQPQGGLQKLEGLTGILLVDGLDLRLETEGAQGEIRREERERYCFNPHGGGSNGWLLRSHKARNVALPQVLLKWGLLQPLCRRRPGTKVDTINSSFKRHVWELTALFLPRADSAQQWAVRPLP